MYVFFKIPFYTITVQMFLYGMSSVLFNISNDYLPNIHTISCGETFELQSEPESAYPGILNEKSVQANIT